MKKIIQKLANKAICAAFVVLGAASACAELVKEPIYDDENVSVGYKVTGLENDEVAMVYTNHERTATWTVPATLTNVQFLVVGGGGGGGAGTWGPGGGGGGADNSVDSNERIAGAGGGGGGIVTGLVNFDRDTVVSVTVGAGGLGGKMSVDASGDSGYGGAYNGEASIFGVNGIAWVTADGGGSDQGASANNSYLGGKDGSAGGSGAGGRANANGGAETQGDVTSANVTSSHKYGFPGGNGCTEVQDGYGYGAAGGGGGATAAGDVGTRIANYNYKGGNGGDGLSSDITGIATVYGSGGGGSSTWGAAGIGGEGAGDGVVAGNGKNALANQGGGGGGSSRKAATGGNGGSGIVVFRFVYPEVASVDGYGYLDLGEAISAADAGETVTLLANAGNIELGKSIALNLNGCTVDQITLTGTDVTLTAPKDLEVKTSVDGYEVAYDDGVYSLQKVAVVQIGETTYATLAEAVAAAQSGDTIVLIENVELAETVTIPVGKTLTIDLNGKSISMEESIVTTAYALNNLGTLTLTDSVGTGSVNARGIYNGYGNGADNVATAKIIIQSGTYNAKGTNGGAAIFNYGIAEINGGSFTSIGGYSLNNQAGSSMTIADGVTANNGIYCSNAKVTVNGGNISGNRSGCHVVYAWNAELTINGGTFYNNNSGNATIMSAGTTKCTITGGTFGIKDGRVEGNGNTWTSCLTDTANTATMTVTGGIFNGGFRVQAGTTMTIEGGSFNDVGGSGYNIYGTASVKGGTFTDSTAQNFAKANLADGFELNVDGNVVEIPAVAQIGETKYATLSEALAAANSGDTVTLLTNVEISDSILLDKSLTLDLGGNTITSSNNRSIKINTSGNAAEEIVIKNGTVVSTPDGGRCIQLGGDSLKTLELNGLTLKAENGQYTQTITLAETNSTEPLEFVVKNSTVVASDNNGYAVIFFCPVDVTVEESTMSGYAALYFKNFGAANDSSGSEVSIKDSHLIGTNVQGGKNTFGTISTEADNIAITVSGGSITAQKTNASIQTIVYCGWSNDESTGLNASFDTELILGEGCRILDEFEDLSVQTVSVRAEYAQSLKDAGYAVQPVEGATGMIQISDAVAEVNGVGFATLSEAFAAVTDDTQTVTVLKDVTENLTGAYLRGNITTENDAKVTINLTNSDWLYCPYTFVLGTNVTLKCPALFYYAGGAQINGKLIVDAYYQMYAGTKLTINEPGSMTVTTEQFYLRYTDGDANAGIYINGDNDDSTIGLNTSVIYFYQGMINAKNANIKASVYWQTNETDGQGSANLVLDNSKLNVTVNEQKVKATGNSTVTLTNGSELIAPGGFEVGGVLKSSCDITGAISKISDQATIEISGGTYTQDVSDWCVDGYAAVKTLDNKYVVSAMPTATISNLGSITVGLGDYKADAYMMYDIINGGKLQEATVPYDLTLAMDFKAKDTAETAAQNAFGNYTTDFFITMSGMSQASFVGDGCYLAGYYPSFKAWVKIPLDGFTVENGKVYPVITSAGFDFKYTDICGTVGQFICGIYLTPEVLAANPNLTVDLTLGLAENKDAALNAQFFKVDNYVYDVDDLVTLPEVVITDIKSTLTDADPDLTFALNFAIKDVDKLSEEYLEKLFAKYGDYYTDYVLTISGLTDPNGSVKFNANGNGDGYLAGQYDAWSKSWVTVPFSDVTVKNGQSFYIMEYAAELMGKSGLRFTLKEIAEIVKNFDCGVYFTPEFLAANPNLKVDLELKVFTEDESGNKVGDISVATNTFDKDDFSVEAAKLDIRIVNGKPQIGFAGEGKLVLNAATALTGEWTKNIEYTLVENDGDDTKTWVTPAEGYYFFKGFITK